MTPIAPRPKIAVPPEARKPCVTAPKPAIDPVTNRASEAAVYDMSASDRTEVISCNRKRAAAIAALDAANGDVP